MEKEQKDELRHKLNLILSDENYKVIDIIKACNDAVSLDIKVIREINKIDLQAEAKSIQDILCTLVPCSFAELISSTRKREIVYARFVGYNYMRKDLGMTFDFIGDCFNKDHASVIHGIKTFKNLQEQKAQDLVSLDLKFREILIENTLLSQN